MPTRPSFKMKDYYNMQINEALKIIIPIEARILLTHASGFSHEYLITHREDTLPDTIVEKFLGLIERRKNGEPIAYIIGVKEFYSRDFKVTPDVLIPRPDSETLIDAVLRDASTSSNNALEILELGVGSGCLITTLLAEMPDAKGEGVDISMKALEISNYNAVALGVKNRIALKISDWFSNITGAYDIIISNPPYIYEEERDLMALETLKYEPHLALFGGLEPYKIISNEAYKFLKQQGKIYVEIGARQAEEIEKIFISKGYIVIGKHQDIEGRIRVLAFALETV